MRKLVVPCFLFVVTILSLIITVSLILIVISPNYSTDNFSFDTALLGIICSVSIFYISVFINIMLQSKQKEDSSLLLDQ